MANNFRTSLDADRAALLSPTMIAAENARFMSSVYIWMTAGLTVTGLIAYGIGNDEELAQSIIANRPLFWGLIIAQLVVLLKDTALAYIIAYDELLRLVSKLSNFFG